MPIYPAHAHAGPERRAAVREAVARLDRAHADTGRRAHASSLVASALKRVDPRDRGPVALRFAALLRHHRLVDFALGRAAEDALARAVAPELLDGALSPDEARALVPGVDWARVLDWRARLPSDATHARAIERSLPTWVAARWDDARAEAMLEPPPTTLRANALRTDRDALAARLADREPRPGRWARHALHLDRPGALWRTEAFLEGLFEAQDEGSQLIAELVAPPPGGTVLDACAGAGGKTLAIAALMGGRGRIVATDAAEEKLATLRERARRAGASSVRATIDHGAIEALRYDRVLVDAPCSGSGTWRRNPEAKIHAEERELARFASQQLDIASAVVRLLAPGGRLVYATCSMFPEENEAVVDALLARFDGLLEPVRVAEIHGKAWAAPFIHPSGHAIALAPERHGTDGFYAAVLRRRRA